MIMPLSAEDLGRVLEIERASFSDPWSLPSFESSLSFEDSCCWGWKENGLLHGYLIANACQDEMQILNVAVAPESRRHGIGHALLKHSIQWARNNQVGRIFLEVRSSNQAAIALYRSFGFKPVYTRKKFYYDPVEDAYVMLLDLEGETEEAKSTGPDSQTG